MFYYLKRGLGEPPHGSIKPMELAFRTDTKELLIGLDDGTCHTISQIVLGPEDHKLYTKIDDNRYIPLGFRV